MEIARILKLDGILILIFIPCVYFLMGCGSEMQEGDGSSPCGPVSVNIPISGGEAASCDGKLKVTIPDGALQSPSFVSIGIASTFPPGNFGRAYDVRGINSISAESGMTMTLIYDPESIGVAETDLRLGITEGQAWRVVPNSFPVLEKEDLNAVLSELNGIYGAIPNDVLTSDTTPPPAPTNLSAVRVGPEQIDLQWDASIDQEPGKVVRYGIDRIDLTTTESAFFESIQGFPPPTSYSDLEVFSDHQYCYWVHAIDDSGNLSPPSIPPACI